MTTPDTDLQPLYPLLFADNLHEKVWGGLRLRRLKGLAPQGEPIGESWEVSAVAASPGVVSNGPLAGRTLPELVAAYGARITGGAGASACGDSFPLLVKLLDAAAPLSVQVHPDDSLAARRHGSRGKTEMWYILDAEPGAHIYLGFERPVGPEEFERRIAEGTLCEVLRRLPARAGDVFFIPAGCVHSLGAGLVVAEIQESSDVTYRIHDFGRPRELHVAQALEAVDYSLVGLGPVACEPRENAPVTLVADPHFTVSELRIDRPLSRRLAAAGTFVVCLCLEGSCRIRVDAPSAFAAEVILEAGRSCLIPASLADYTVSPGAPGGRARLLESHAAPLRPE